MKKILKLLTLFSLSLTSKHLSAQTMGTLPCYVSNENIETSNTIGSKPTDNTNCNWLSTHYYDYYRHKEYYIPILQPNPINAAQTVVKK